MQLSHASGFLKLKALSWKLLGLTIMGTSLLVAWELFEGIGSELHIGIYIERLVLVPAAIPILIGWHAYQHGKKLLQPDGWAVLAADPRPPILYLRSFKDDPVAAKSKVLAKVFTRRLEQTLDTEEEQLSRAMNELGPFITIGRPGENLPELGAARIYVSDDEWRETVDALSGRAQFTVLRAGDTPGFWWEFRNTISRYSPEKLVLLIPAKQQDAVQFADAANRLLPKPLHVDARRILPSDSLASIAAVVYFECDWTPHVCYLDDYRNIVTQGGSGFGAQLKAALAPMVETLKLTWARPPKLRRFVTPADVIIATVLILSLLCFFWLVFRISNA